MEDPSRQLDAITRELLEPDREDHIALRKGQRYATRLVRSQQIADRLELPTQGVFRLAKGTERTLSSLWGTPWLVLLPAALAIGSTRRPSC